MAYMALTIRIMPTGVDVDLNKILEELKGKLKVYSSEVQPIAFGLKALNVTIIASEDESQDAILETIKSIDGVESAEVVQATRTMDVNFG